MINVILLWSDSLLRIKIVKVIAFLKKCLKGFWEIFYDNFHVPGYSGMFRNVPGCSVFQVLTTPLVSGRYQPRPQ